ncbi:MAG: hypothetical protein MK160_06355 [Rhodobacteraceae bacterium]|nr:hypothetical protein [Paracoccaceae bacterium]
MAPSTKVATCCYCGTKAALVLSGHTKHELVCSSCGAPLHDMKMLRADHPSGSYKTGKKAQKVPKRPASPSGWEHPDSDRRKKKKKHKKRKSFGARLFEEAFDVLEDIFD